MSKSIFFRLKMDESVLFMNNVGKNHFYIAYMATFLINYKECKNKKSLEVDRNGFFGKDIWEL